MRNYFAIIAVGFLIIAGFLVYHSKQQDKQSEMSVNGVSYVCDGGKTIDASFSEKEPDPSISAEQELPVSNGIVDLVLSDGRVLSLPQTISASGVRYANTDESFVFWSKGNGALILENNEEKSYIGCIRTAEHPGGLSKVYHPKGGSFSIRYPDGYTVDELHLYQALGPGKEIYGVKFTIPVTLAEGTNLSSDSYISIEQLTQTASCDADLFLTDGIDGGELTAHDKTYSIANQFDAGAGNRYEETVLAISGTNPCMAIRYFIHYTALENYPDGTVRRFDADQLREEFSAIRDTLVLNQ